MSNARCNTRTYELSHTECHSYCRQTQRSMDRLCARSCKSISNDTSYNCRLQSMIFKTSRDRIFTYCVHELHVIQCIALHCISVHTYPWTKTYFVYVLISTTMSGLRHTHTRYCIRQPIMFPLRQNP